MKKAQISIEFLFAIGIVIFLFLIILGFSLERRKELNQTEDYLNKRSECLKISDLIMGVFVNGNGAIVSTTTNYGIEIQPNSRSVCVEDVCCSFSIDSISDVDLISGSINIQNKNNFIVVENV